MGIRITPSILNANLADLNAEIARIPSADGVHLDVMDNRFVPNLTFGLPMVECVRAGTDKLLDIVKTGTDPQLRSRAISALTSKKDPRTLRLLMEIIDK